MPPEQDPYVVLLGGEVTTGDLTSDNDDNDAAFRVVVVQATTAPYVDLGVQHSMNIAILREDAIELADAIRAAALSLPE